MLLGNLRFAAVVIASRRTLAAVILLQELVQGKVRLVPLAYSHLSVTILKIIVALI